MNAAATPEWKRSRERSSPAMVALMAWIALRLGRGVARLVLGPVVLYFYLTAGPVRRSLRVFLRRAGAPRQGALGVLRTLYAFATCALDRVYLLAGRHQELEVTVHDPQQVLARVHGGGGALMLTAHLGSYDVLRVVGAVRRGVRYRIVMDQRHGGIYMGLLTRLNPKLADELIDGSRSHPQLGLALHEALHQGCLVGLMADRTAGRDRGLPVEFLGARARLPEAPWKLAAVLGAPVVLCFGLYRGGRRYTLHFERFLDGQAVPRAQRDAFIRACVERYARRLEHYARAAPDNWFNFYDFWSAARPGEQPDERKPL